MLQEKPVCLLTDTKDHGWSWSGQIKRIPKKAKWLQQRKLDSCEQISCLENMIHVFLDVNNLYIYPYDNSQNMLFDNLEAT